MSSLSFEWNKKKSTSNLKKHGVSFEEATTVFSDDFGRLIPDPDSQGEERFILMGMSSQARILTQSLRKKFRCYSYYLSQEG